MKRHGSSVVWLGVALGLLTIPAGGAQAATAKSCFWARNVNEFRSIDNRTAYIRVNGRDVYELKLFAYCPGVNWGRVALSAHGSSQVCEGTGNWVEIHTRSGGPTRTCKVSEVRKLTPGEVAALPNGARP